MATTHLLHARYHSLLLLICIYELNEHVIIKMMPNFPQATVVIK